MIRDAKGGLFSSVIDWYIGRKVRSAFRGVWVRGELPVAASGLIAYLNHSSFWDGFLVHQLGKLAGWDTYALMEEQNLARYRFHTRIGAFSVRRGDPRSAVETLRYAKTVLERPNACVTIFPQGELRQGPLGPLSRGIEVLARSSRRQAVPIALRYAFFEHEHPDVLVEVGAPHAPGPMTTFTEQLESVTQRVHAARSTEGFTLKIAGRRSVQERWDTVRSLPPTTQEGAPAARG
ncbi:MAG: lysophospholipid acyltransferase family protein [Myxococcaceae bacterium]|nr:lysophospholipid acyltransferase family protein [Myxococcaceae bacterium]